MRLHGTLTAALLLSTLAPLALTDGAWAKGKPAPTRSAKSGKHTQGRAKHAPPAPRPVSVYTHEGFPNIQAEAAVVVDIKAQKELYQKHPDEVRPIASISKLMAMMEVLDHKLDLDAVTEMLPADRDAAKRGARSRLPTGTTFTNKDLLHAALMASDNRAVLALGRAVGLSPEQLTAEMNKKSQALGLKSTSFGDPTGLNDGNRSTPREVAKFLGAAIQYPLIAEITHKPQYIAHGVNKPNYAVEYNNTDLIARGSRYSVLGGKTGYSDLAGYCLAIAAKVDDRELAMVFLGAHGKLTRFGDFSRCAQWVCEKKPSSGAARAASKTL